MQGQQYRKADEIEDNIIEKKIIDANKLKEQLQAQLSNIEYRLDNLSSQRIDNPKSLYSHPVLKQYLESDQDRKTQQASRFIKRMKLKQDEFKDKLRKKEIDLENKKNLEGARALRMQTIQKQNAEKEKEDRFKQKLLMIKQRQELRIKEINEFEEIYNRKIKKDTTKRPLFVRFTKKYQNQEKIFREKQLKEIKENKKQFLNVAQIDFKSHEKKYFENLQELQKQHRMKREQLILSLNTKQPTPNLVYDSSKLLKNEISNNQFSNQIEALQNAKENALKILEARNKFSSALKQHQQLSPSKDKQLEMEILIDKQTNPNKYLPLVKRTNQSERYQQFIDKGKLLRKSSADFSIRKSSSSMSIFNLKSFQTPKIGSKNVISAEDEMIFKEKVKQGFQRQEAGKEREIGKQYLKSIRESSRQYMEYLKQRQQHQDNSQFIKLPQEQMSNNDQNEVSEARSPNQTTASPQKSSKDSENKIILPQIRNNNNQKENSNSFSNNNSRFSYQLDQNAQKVTNKNNNSLKNEKQPFSLPEEYTSLSTEERKKQVIKQNYMGEIRQKYHLGGRKEAWEKINDQNTSLPILSKQKLLTEASYKYDEEIRRKEQILRSHRPEELSLREVNDRQTLDDAYLKSIKAKIEMVKLTIENDEFVKKKDQSRYYGQKQNEQRNS